MGLEEVEFGDITEDERLAPVDGRLVRAFSVLSRSFMMQLRDS